MTASPCIGICKLDRRTQICQGCGRTIAEIAAWPSLTGAQRREILARLAETGGGPARPGASEA